MELFAGRGGYRCNGTECLLEGSVPRVLRSQAKFSHYAFLTRNGSAAADLTQAIAQPAAPEKIGILSGNCNHPKTLRKLLDYVPRSTSSLAFIDPGGYLKIHWDTIEQLSVRGKNWEGGKMELLIIFPLEMALVKNLMRTECEPSITRFYGNREWERLKRQKLGGKIGNQEIQTGLVEIFKNGLKNLGYRYVDDFRPLSPTAEPYYHLICANDSGSRAKILQEAWGKTRYLRCELLYGSGVKKKRTRSSINI